MNIPFDRVLVPGPYGQQHLGFIATSTPQQLGQYVALYALTLLNMSYQTTNTSNVRRFMNNMLTANNFNNQQLNELVDLAFRMGWHMVVTRQRPSLDHQSTIMSACEKALGVTAAVLMVANPPLIQDQPATKIEEIRKIAAGFQQERSVYYRYTFSELGVDQSGRVGSPVNGCVSSVGFTDTSSITPLNVSSPASDSANDFEAEWGPIKTSLQQPTPEEPTSSVETQVSEDTTYSIPTYTKPAPPPEPVQSVKVPDYKPRTYPKTIVTHKGVHEMDATTHARAYFGNMEVQAEQALINLRADSFNMATSLSEPQGSVKRLTLEELKVEMTLDALFMSARANHLSFGLKRGRVPQITRIMGISLNPVFSDKLFESKQSFIFQQDIRKIGDYLKDVVGSKDEKHLTPEQHVRLVTASYIDRTLGRMTNDFFARGLRLRAGLTTFADSISQASEFVSGRCPTDYNPLFQSFLSSLSKNLRDYSQPETVNMARESVLTSLKNKGEDVSQVGVVVLPVGHTVTFCNLTQTELEWETKWNGSDIDPKVTPTLAEMCFTLREDKRAFNFSSTYDWLLTGDGETFLIYENPDNRGGYRMYPDSGLNINRIDI